MNSPYVKPAIIVSNLHDISIALKSLAFNSVTHVFDCSCGCWRNGRFCFLEIKVDDQVVLSTVYEKQTVDTKLLCSLAEPAPFGKGSMTVIDNKVHKALEIKADCISIMNNNYLFSEVTNTLAKVAPPGKVLTPKLYKMHIYKKGGMFLTHCNTLHALNHYATLIVGLPMEYTGGKFVLDVGDGKTECFDFQNMDTNQFLVFLTGMPHQVMKIKTGVRVVLQYDMYLKDKWSKMMMIWTMKKKRR